MRFQDYLFKPIDNTPIVLWRVVFGLVMFFETWGAIAVGWVKQVYIDPPAFTFSFIGFEFLQPLPGYSMYIWFALLGVLSIGVILGYRYRLSILLFTVGWMGVYFMHKTSYNNHHYLMTLLCIMMCIVPANKALSLDVKQGRVTSLSYCHNLYLQLFIWLFLIVFTYASIAKIYPDWLNGVPLTQWLEAKKESPIGFFFQNRYQALLMSWGGIFFDLLIIPALLWSKTRRFAFWISIYFHLMNSITFQIGTFPYMMIGACVLFYPPEKLRKWFRINEKQYNALPKITVLSKKVMTITFIGFFIIKILLPLRHYVIPGNVFWTEEGHKLSWRMMLRSKRGSASFYVTKPNGEVLRVNAKNHMTPKQYRTMATHPDMVWQFCQYLKELHGPDIHIKVTNYVSLNFRQVKPMIDPDYDMAKAEWHLFQHEEWILDGPDWSDK